jgi:hypothetical protein
LIPKYTALFIFATAMTFSSATVVAMLLACKNFGQSDAFNICPSLIGSNRHLSKDFTPQRNLQPSIKSRGVRIHDLVSLNFAEISGGIEELQELNEKQSTNIVEKQVRKSPSFWKIAGYVTIPISAALGFGLVPSRRLAAHAAGAIVTGVAGAIGKSRLDAFTESAALPAIAQVVIDHGIEDPTTTNGYIKEIKDLYGIIDADDFEARCAEVYSKYLLGMVKYNPMPKSSEPKELEKLKAALGLNNLWVGEAHASAAQQWYRTTCYYTPEEDLEDPEHPDRQAMDKFLFLTERALRQGNETNEAFKFEMTRVAKAMKLSFTTALDRVAEVQEPFYHRALRSTRAKLGSNQVSASMLDRARQTLGIDEETAFDMHVACFNEEVREQLGLKAEEDDDDAESKAEEIDFSKAKFKDDSKQRVSHVLSIVKSNSSNA